MGAGMKLYVSPPFRLWCAEHDRAPESWDKWPTLIPQRVAQSPTHEASMADFDKDGKWVINVKAMSCGDNGWLCHEKWTITKSVGKGIA